jgi:hypothetical protein
MILRDDTYKEDLYEKGCVSNMLLHTSATILTDGASRH